MLMSVQHYQEEGAFADAKAAHVLHVHLTTVQGKRGAEKVVKHLNGFEQLLQHQKDEQLISKNAYQNLKVDADILIKQYQ